MSSKNGIFLRTQVKNLLDTHIETMFNGRADVVAKVKPNDLGLELVVSHKPGVGGQVISSNIKTLETRAGRHIDNTDDINHWIISAVENWFERTPLQIG